MCLKQYLDKPQISFKWSDYIYLILACLGVMLFILGIQIIVVPAVIIPMNYHISLEKKITLAIPKEKDVFKPISTITPLCVYLDASTNKRLNTRITLDDNECKDWNELYDAITPKIKALNSNEIVPIQIYAEDKVPMQAIVKAMDIAMEFQDRCSILINDFIHVPKITRPAVTQREPPPRVSVSMGFLYHIQNSGVIGYIIIVLGIITILAVIRLFLKTSNNTAPSPIPLPLGKGVNSEGGYWQLNIFLLVGILAIGLIFLGAFTNLFSIFTEIKSHLHPRQEVILGYLSRLLVIAFEGFAVSSITFSIYWYFRRRRISYHK